MHKSRKLEYYSEGSSANFLTWEGVGALFMGILAFFVIFGGEVLNPSHVNWLIHGDPAQHFLGWHFFRQAPLLQFPLGANPRYGMDVSSSIVFSDSIPLMALIFKPLSPLLPEVFQYTGLWILLCFILQAYFSNKLLGIFTQDLILRLLGTAFFVTAPIWIFRLTAHFALGGQWVILAALFFYFSKDAMPYRWYFLLWIVALIHAYLLFMVGSIWLADIACRVLSGQSNLKKSIIYLIGGLFSTLVVMCNVGYFMVGGDVGADGFGFHRFNLMAPINPLGWSQIMSKVSFGKWGEGDYEGFSYIGLGMFGLCVIAATQLRSFLKPSQRIRQVLPLIIILLMLFIVSASNKMAFGSKELFTYPLPHGAEYVTGVLRSSGRLIWPVYYALFTLSLVIVFKQFSRSAALGICLAMLSLQLWDIGGRLLSFRVPDAQLTQGVKQLDSAAWKELAHHYKRVIYVFPGNGPKDWLPICQFAAMNGMTINMGYFARMNSEKVDQAGARLTDTIINSAFDPEALYVFHDNVTWTFASTWNHSLLSSNDVSGVMDGYRILAPRLKVLNPQLSQEIEQYGIPDIHLFDCKLDENINFNRNGKGSVHAVLGWYDPEELGVWSKGNGILALILPESVCKDFEVMIDGHALLSGKNSPVKIEVVVNNQSLEILEYSSSENGVKKIRIPSSLVAARQGRLLIELRIIHPTSPKALGFSSDDSRILGIDLFSLRVSEGGEHKEKESFENLHKEFH